MLTSNSPGFPRGGSGGRNFSDSETWVYEKVSFFHFTRPLPLFFKDLGSYIFIFPIILILSILYICPKYISSTQRKWIYKILYRLTPYKGDGTSYFAFRTIRQKSRYLQNYHVFPPEHGNTSDLRHMYKNY